MNYHLTWLRQLKLKGTRKAVLFVLADHAGRHDEVWLRVDTISEESGCYRNTVIAALDDLEKLGHIEDTGERKGLTRSIKTYRLKPGNQPARSSVKKHTAKQCGFSRGSSVVFHQKRCGFSSEAVCKTAPVAASKTTLLHEATTLDSETPKPIEAPKKLVVVEAGVQKAQTTTTTTNLDELIEELKPIYPNHDLGREFEKCRRYNARRGQDVTASVFKGWLGRAELPLRRAKPKPRQLAAAEPESPDDFGKRAEVAEGLRAFRESYRANGFPNATILPQ